MKYLAKNIFNIEDVDNYLCYIQMYYKQHSTLIVIVNHISEKKKRKYILSFLAMEYFEGPMSWKGADFRIATSDECRNFLQKRNIPNADVHSETMKLFIVMDEEFGIKIKILAGGVHEVDQMPNLLWVQSPIN